MLCCNIAWIWICNEKELQLQKVPALFYKFLCYRGWAFSFYLILSWGYEMARLFSCFNKVCSIQEDSCAILISFKIVVIFNITSADFVLIQLMLYWKWQQFWKKWGSRNWGLKMNGVYKDNLFLKWYHQIGIFPSLITLTKNGPKNKTIFVISGVFIGFILKSFIKFRWNGQKFTKGRKIWVGTKNGNPFEVHKRFCFWYWQSRAPWFRQSCQELSQ